MNIPLPKSFSNIGRTADAAQKSTKKVHVHKEKVVLQPWDGLDLVEQILAEARSKSDVNPRENLAISSPRVNPLLVDKSQSETKVAAFSSFLSSTAASIDLPAAHTARGDSSDENDDQDHPAAPVRSRKGHSKRRTVKPSSCFLTGQRPDPGNASGAPPVGKYTPKHNVVERRGPTIVLSRLQKRHPHPRRTTPALEQLRPATTASGTKPNSPTGVSATAPLGSTKEAEELSGSFGSVNPLTRRREETPAHAFRKHQVRDVSSAFKSNASRSPVAPSRDLSYWPIPTTGTTTYHAGAFHGNARERSYTPFGVPQGALTDYDVSLESRPSSVNLSRGVDRAHHKLRIMYPTEDTTQLAYRPDEDKLSTRAHAGGHYAMSKFVSRPGPRPATPGEPLDPYFNSMVTSPKKGFVDVKRMTYKAQVYADDDDNDAAARAPVSQVQYTLVECRSPTPTMPKAQRDFDSSLSRQAVDVSYSVSDASVRRHRPECVMMKTDRKTFEVRQTCLRDEPYQTDERPHVTVVEFTKQISRDVRDKRFEFK